MGEVLKYLNGFSAVIHKSYEPANGTSSLSDNALLHPSFLTHLQQGWEVSDLHASAFIYQLPSNTFVQSNAHEKGSTRSSIIEP